MSTKKRVELINYKKFAAAVLDSKKEAFVIHVVLLEIQKIVHLSYRAQIASFITNKRPVEVLKEYVEYIDVFFKETATELQEHTGINNHYIDLEKSKQPSYGLIYSLGLVELEILKAYIKHNLKIDFIRPSKSPSGAVILFIKKTNHSLQLYMDY